MTENTPYIEHLRDELPQYLAGKRSVLTFLGCVVIFAALFVAVYHPVSMMRTSQVFAPLGYQFYTAVLTLTGLAILIISRIVLIRVNRGQEISLVDGAIWIVAEMFVISIATATLAFCINTHPEVSWGTILGRAFIDVLSVMILPYLISGLIFMVRQRNSEVETLREQLKDAQRPTNEISIGEALNFYDKGGKLAFATKSSNVLYIEASDNYTNIHYISDDKEECFILHNSMKNVEEAYAPMGMMRCHRGFLVNLANVKLLRKDKDGLVLELNNGTRAIPVSKSYAEAVVRYFADKEE